MENEDIEYKQDIEDIDKICDIIEKCPKDVDIDTFQSFVDVLSTALIETRKAGIPEKYLVRLQNMEHKYRRDFERLKEQHESWEKFCQNELERFKEEISQMSQTELMKKAKEIETELKNNSSNKEKYLLLQKSLIITPKIK